MEARMHGSISFVSTLTGGALLLALGGCSVDLKGDTTPDEQNIPDGEATGKMYVDVAGDSTMDTSDDGDLPDGVEQVWLTIDKVEVHHQDEGWISISESSQDVELVGARETPERVAEGDIYDGSYDQVRLTIGDAWVIVDGDEQYLQVDGNATFDAAVDLGEDEEREVFLGWDLDQNLDDSDGSWALGADVSVDVDVDVNL
jgi:hypothetical protein